MAQGQKPVCEVCIRIRWFMAIAIPLVVLIGAQSDIPLPNIPLPVSYTHLTLPTNREV